MVLWGSAPRMGTEPVDPDSDAAAVDFLARLGGAMVAANYPINLVRRTLTMSAGRYGLANHLLVLPNYIQLGGSDHAGGTPVRVSCDWPSDGPRDQ